MPAVSLLFRIGDVIGMLALAARDRDDHRDAHVVLDGMASVLPGLYADVYAVIDAIREDSAVTWAARVQWRKSMGI